MELNIRVYSTQQLLLRICLKSWLMLLWTFEISSRHNRYSDSRKYNSIRSSYYVTMTYNTRTEAPSSILLVVNLRIVEQRARRQRFVSERTPQDPAMKQPELDLLSLDRNPAIPSC